MRANYVQRLRVQFAKVGPTRYIGHLDLARALERSLNRAQIPLAYTQGFNPRPRMQLAAALPLGFTSECELADIWLLERVEPDAAHSAMVTAAPPGIEIEKVSEAALGEAALQNMVSEAVYVATISEQADQQGIARSIDQFMATESIIRKRRGKAYDLRPLVLEVALAEGSETGPSVHATQKAETSLKMRLSMLPGRTGRPDEVLEALGFDPLAARIHRQRLVLADG